MAGVRSAKSAAKTANDKTTSSKRGAAAAHRSESEESSVPATTAKAKAKAKPKPKPAASKKATAQQATTKRASSRATTAATLPKQQTPQDSAVSDGGNGDSDAGDIKVIKQKSKPATKAKTLTTTTTKSAAKMAARKRKADESDDDEPTVIAPARVKKAKVVKKNPIINQAPEKVLECFVFGEGSGGELGLGTRNRDKDVKRPRLNPNLDAKSVGIVQIATGGMHTLALTRDNRIISWGVNDQGALGRNTDWSGGLRDVDAEEDSDSDEDSPDADSGMNPHEATPTAISTDAFPEDTTFTQLAAGDSCSFALTDDGQVWGWGTFRSDDGILGFTPTIRIQKTPMLMPTLHKIVKISCGQNHAVALDVHGSVFAWGSGQQAQIGRKILERHRLAGLTPGEFGLPKRSIKDIETGQNHAFAIDNKDRVWAWGFNGFGQTGISEGAGEDEAFVSTPTIVKCLSGRSIKFVTGGGLHSMAIDANGHCLAWGRIDNNQLGIPVSDMNNDHVVRSPETDKPRILTEPTRVGAITDTVANIGLGADHCLVVTTGGKAYSWGFSANYQTGQGTDDDVVTPTLIDNTAVREKHLNGAHAGGQFGILTAAVAEA